MSSIAGTVTIGVRWIIDSVGTIVGYRNPISDKDEVWALGGVVEQDGTDYLVGSDGTTLYPLPLITGNLVEPEVAGAVTFSADIDAGSDIDHPQLLWTINCGIGETPDNSLASDRFADYATHPEVWRSGIDGAASAQMFLIHVPAGATLIHFALAGAGSYTDSGSATIGASTMCVFVLEEATPANVIVLTLLSPKTLGGSNNRGREISIMPTTAA